MGERSTGGGVKSNKGGRKRFMNRVLEKRYSYWRIEVKGMGLDVSVACIRSKGEKKKFWTSGKRENESVSGKVGEFQLFAFFHLCCYFKKTCVFTKS